MNWDDLRIFLAVARAGQILGAARRLGLNHATVSRRLTALEEALSVKLFHRQTNGCELTESGGRFLEIAERVEREMNEVRGAVAENSETVTGTVRIGAPDGFGVAFLAPRLATLTTRNPDLSVQLVPVPRSFSLSRHEADIAITVDRPSEGRLVARKLVDYTLALYASRDYAARAGLPEYQEALKDHPLVGYVGDLVIDPTLDYACEFSPRWNARFQISSALGQVEAVRAGAGIGILHSFIARAYGDLVPVPCCPPIRRAYWLVYHESMRPLRSIRVVADFINSTVNAERTLFSGEPGPAGQ
jgi:DNA-binding transcriptional LysR family regulator